MLENEPDTHQPVDGEQSTPAATPPPRRRRAASRPAGPPATAADAPPIETVSAPEPVIPEPVTPEAVTPEVSPQVVATAPEQGQAEVSVGLDSTQVEQPAPAADDAQPVVPVKKAAAKRPARKTAAKKTAAAVETSPVDGAPVEVTPSDQAEAAVEAPKKRAPRKRAAKKVADPAAAVESVDASIAPGEVVAAPAGWEQPTSDALPAESATEPVATEQFSVEPVTQLDEQPVEETLVEEELVEQDATAAALETPGPATSDATPEAEAAPAARDFGWLADPFAASAPVSDAKTDDADESADTAEKTSEQDDSSDQENSSDDDDDSGDGSSRRRRRRRGGRRRRRSGGDSDSNDNSDSDSNDEDDNESDSDDDTVATADASSSAPKDSAPKDAPDAEGAGADDSGKESDGDDSEGQGRRRRRRRRRGEETAALPDDPSDVVVRVREPRPRKKAASSSNEITGIEGSTRMEAKRQRRKDGRDAGRRRAPILSEAEFLARRESVNRQMIIRQREDLTQIAVLEDGILVEHYVDRESAASLIGNVYLGRVQNVLPSMEAAFIDIGRGRNAVLYAGEVDWDSFGAEGHGRKVEKVLKSGQMILVQVSKDPVGAKGARLTNHVSIPGRYIVYAPGGHLSGISRKLPDVERRRLKDILSDLVGESASVIVRTAAEGASEDELVRDVNRLKAQWEDIERKVKAGNSPQLLYGEPDLTVRIVRDLFTEDFSELVISGNGAMNDAYDAIQGYVTHVAPHLQERIRRWEQTGDVDLFSEYRLNEQIAKALERKVFLPSGGSLVIDRTEAMTVIDVNTGKFTGTGGNLEATVTSNNLEAAEEIVNQLRLRDIGGIIVIDFIDMVLPNNRELLLRRLVECLGRDRTRHQVAEVTSLGLVQMTRKKIGTGLLEAFGTECPVCHGRGYELHDMPVDTQKQADGGAREQQRPRDQRPKPGDTRTANGSRGGRGDSNRNDGNRNDGNRNEGNRNDGNRNDSRGSERGGNDRGGNAREYDRIESEAEEVSQLAAAEPSVTPEPTLVEPEPSSVVPKTTPVVSEPTSVVDETPDSVEAPVAEHPASPTADVESAPVEPSPVPEAGVTDEPISSPEAPVSSNNGSSDNGSSGNWSSDNGSSGRAQYNDSLHDTPLEDEAPTAGGNGQSSRSRRGRRGGGRGGSSRRDQDNAPASESTPTT